MAVVKSIVLWKRSFLRNPDCLKILLFTFPYSFIATHPTHCEAMDSTQNDCALLSPPGDIQHLIMLEVFNSQELAISNLGKHDTFQAKPKPLFTTAPLRVCKQMRFDALDILMRGIELRIFSLCDMVDHVPEIPIDLRACIRYLDTAYNYRRCGHVEAPGDNWLGQEALKSLPNLEVIMVNAR